MNALGWLVVRLRRRMRFKFVQRQKLWGHVPVFSGPRMIIRQLTGGELKTTEGVIGGRELGRVCVTMCMNTRVDVRRVLEYEYEKGIIHKAG